MHIILLEVKESSLLKFNIYIQQSIVLIYLQHMRINLLITESPY